MGHAKGQTVGGPASAPRVFSGACPDRAHWPRDEPRTTSQLQELKDPGKGAAARSAPTRRKSNFSASLPDPNVV